MPRSKRATPDDRKEAKSPEEAASASVAPEEGAARGPATEVWACGANSEGELGVGDTKNRRTPTEVTALHGHRIHVVACGSFFAVAVVDDGELWATGSNIQVSEKRVEFSRVSALSGQKVATVACGRQHTLALLESGELFAWGWNYHGQLGIGDTETTIPDPQPVAALSGRRVAAIACGDRHSVAVLETGELFAWGWNGRGQLGLGDDADRHVPVQVTALSEKRIVAVACGADHSAAVSETGELFMWGKNDCGELGLGDITFRNTPNPVEALSPVQSVACGYNHTIALLKSGEVFSWGWNKVGQLGLGAKTRIASSTTPQQIPFFSGLQVKAVACSLHSSAAVLENGQLFTWGDNFHGQLGTSAKACPAPKRVLGLSSKHVLAAGFGSRFLVALVVA